MVKVIKKVKIDTISPKERKPFLWKGPEEEGITFSLLSRWLTCRERFRLYAGEGVCPADQFNHRIEFGNLWHTCEEALASGGKMPWEDRLLISVQLLMGRYPLDREQIEHWHNVCKMMFPLYVEYWRCKTEFARPRVPVYEEQTFRVPYLLPSGRKVVLLGKWDSVYSEDDDTPLSVAKDRTLWLQENKTKSDINEVQIQRQLTFDLQTMLYVVALRTHLKALKGKGGRRHPLTYSRVEGVRYNVVRRSRHHPGKKESRDDFYGRLKGIIEKEPSTFFLRWDVVVTDEDVQVFRKTCLDPLLENVCGWYDHVTAGRNPYAHVMPMNWRHPFGVYNILDEGGSSDLDEYLATGSTVGLRRIDNLFPELS